MNTVLVKHQKKVTDWKEYEEHGQTYRIRSTVRYDDECGNGHNSFAVTGEIEHKRGNHRFYEHSGGCIHDKVGKWFPEIKPLIKWHLTSSDGPMHYTANTLHYYKKHLFLLNKPTIMAELQKRRDTLKSAGALTLHRFESIWVLEGVYQGKKYSVDRSMTWEKPSVKEMYEEIYTDILGDPAKDLYLNKGDTIESTLASARHCAIWDDMPGGVDVADMEKQVEARLPQLLKDFRKAVEGYGFTY